MELIRTGGRTFNQVRPLTLIYDAFGFADASVLLSIGQTKVQACVSLQNGVPPFLKGKGVGWMTAEYAMLPTSTRSRSQRSTSLAQPNPRGVEISRLIGRSLRSVVDLSGIGEKTIMIDCDVLQADGGTRAACITAASLALSCAARRWVHAGIMECLCMREPVAAISIGVVDGHVYADLTQEEDNGAQVDFNFILAQSGQVIEIQGTAEKRPISWECFDEIKILAIHGVAQLFAMSSQIVPDYERAIIFRGQEKKAKIVVGTAKADLFSLSNRQH